MKDKLKKMEKLLRYHRQNVFNEITGYLHEKALIRIKKTNIWKCYMIELEGEARDRQSERMLRLYA